MKERDAKGRQRMRVKERDERERERIEFFIYDRLMLEVKSMKHALFKCRLPSYAPNSIFHKVGSKLYNIGRKCISSFNSVHFYLTGTKLNKKSPF